MTKSLTIARELALPLDAVTQTLAAIGRKGSGKTYLATMLAEQMLDAGAQVVAVDSVGNWWGLRVDADGKSPGKEIFVIGGEHGDVALVPEAGARIARLIVDRGISAVLDISGFRLGERKRFAADFGEELLHLKKSKRSPVHLFLEEAQLLIPQRVGPDEARMVGAFEQLVRLGRNYGIGCTLVTQRPQSVNKEVLSQVECLCVLQVTGPHERKALEEWVQEAGADRKLVGELPGLGRGEGYVWSPAWLHIYKRVHFASKTTFDASATPEVGKATRAASLSAVDVEALKTDLADVVAKAAAEDPKALRKRIVELERELASKPVAAPDAAQKVERVEVPVLGKSDAMRFEDSVFRLLKAQDRLVQAQQVVSTEAGKLSATIAKATAKPPALSPRPSRIEKVETIKDKAFGANAATMVHFGRSRAEAPTKNANNALGKGERKTLTAIAQHRDGVTREQLTVLTGYKRSSRDTYLRRLSAKDFVVQSGDQLVVTDTGLAELGPDFEPLPTGVDLLEHWRQRLPVGERAVLEVLIAAWPASVDRERISEATEYQRSSRDTYLQRLRSRRLVVETGRGQVRASPQLMEAR